MGKTSMALSIARQTALKHSKRVALFSLEMSADQLVQRLLSAQSNVESQRMRKGLISEDEFTLLVNVAGMLGDTSIYIDDTPALTAMGLRSKARRIHSEYGLDLLIVDYLQLMQGDFRSENRVQEISYISRALKGLARELNVPVLALSQLSRAVESRHDKRPMLSDLRESGSIEQDADVVMFIYREDWYFPKEEEWERVQKRRSIHSEYPKNLADLIVAKHRNGPTGVVTLYFDREHTDFREIEVRDVPLEPEEEYV
jgi:replicative DNA helicase